MISLVPPVSTRMVHLIREVVTPLVKGIPFPASEQEEEGLGQILTLKISSTHLLVGGVVRLVPVVVVVAARTLSDKRL